MCRLYENSLNIGEYSLQCFRKKFVHNATELAEREADKYLYIGHAVPSGNSLARCQLVFSDYPTSKEAVVLHHIQYEKWMDSAFLSVAEEGTNEEGTELEEVDPRENDGEEETNIDEGMRCSTIKKMNQISCKPNQYE